MNFYVTKGMLPDVYLAVRTYEGTWVCTFCFNPLKREIHVRDI